MVGIDLRDADVCADLSTPPGREQAVADVLEATDGTLDAVVLSAGLSGVDPRLVSVNFFGVTALLEGFQPALARSAHPRGALVSSVTAIHPADPGILAGCLAGDEEAALAAAATAVAERRGFTLYSTSKAALVQWMRTVCLTASWVGSGIALNAVGPGVVLTPMTEDLFANDAMRKVMDDAVPMPLGGHAPPEAVAHALVWLVSPENTHVTGQLLCVDGGAEVSQRGPLTY